VTIQNYLSSEENFYKETSKYVPGLRKAGKHKLTITGDLLYGGETQVLEGTLKLTGNIPDSKIVVYEGATLELCGNANKVVLAGGKIEACPSAKYMLNFGKMPEDEFFAGKNQVYAHDYSYKLTGKWDFTDTYEFYKYMKGR